MIRNGGRLVDVIVAGETFAQIKWGSQGYCNEEGHDIARTIQKCKDAGLSCTVVGMPTVYAQPPAQKK